MASPADARTLLILMLRIITEDSILEIEERHKGQRIRTVAFRQDTKTNSDESYKER